MTGPKGNSEYGFPETLNVSRGEAKGNTEVKGRKTHCFLQGQSLRVLLYTEPPDSKIAKKLGRSLGEGSPDMREQRKSSLYAGWLSYFSVILSRTT